jgi:hypothetical protein
MVAEIFSGFLAGSVMHKRSFFQRNLPALALLIGGVIFVSSYVPGSLFGQEAGPDSTSGQEAPTCNGIPYDPSICCCDPAVGPMCNDPQ